MDSPNDAPSDAPAESSPTKSTTGRTSTFLVGAFSSLLAIAALSAWLLEGPNYRSLLEVEFGVNEMTPVDDAAVLAAICGKTVLAGIPLAVLCALLHRWGRRWLAGLTLHVGLSGLITWLILDMYLQKLTGNHAGDYAGFLLQPETWQWAGQHSGISRKILVLFVFANMALAAATAPGWLLLHRISLRLGPAGMRRLAWGGAGLSVFVMIAFTALSTVASSSGRLVADALVRQLPWPPLCSGWMGADDEVQILDDSMSARLSEIYEQSFDSLYTAIPVDDGVQLANSARPHIVLFVLESFRHTAATPDTMPNLVRFSQKGVSAQRHYAGSNLSHYGLFSLLYGRSPLVFDQTLNASVPPQLCHTLRQNGYEMSFVTSGKCDGWQRMGEFLNERTFDRVVTHDDESWVDRDRKTLDLTRRIITGAPPGKPQFVLAFLMCTHFNYEFPPDYAVHTPYAEEVSLISIGQPEEIRNRYRNAAGFLDAAVAETVSQLDLGRTIVAITGDHGESLLEDGVMFHGSKLSDIQTRVPFVLFGGGVPRREITIPTTHADLLPTLLHVLAGESRSPEGCHGRSLLDIEMTPENDHVLLFHGILNLKKARNHDRALLAHGDMRVSLQFWRHTPTVRVRAYVDDKDNPIQINEPPERIEKLIQAFHEEMRVFGASSPQDQSIVKHSIGDESL